MYFRLYPDTKQEWRWSLHANNGERIADSGEGYKKKADAIYAIELIKGGAASAPTYE